MRSALAWSAIASDLAYARSEQDYAFATLGRGPTLEEQRQIADLAVQRRELFADLELSLPEPAATATPARYRVELLSRLQRFSPDWRSTNLSRLPSAGIEGIEQAILADARRIATDKTVGSFRRPGALRELRREDQAGNVTTSFSGSPISWMRQFMSPTVACVEAFGRRLG